MKTKRVVQLLLLALQVVVLTMGVQISPTQAATNVGGPVISDTTWTLANSPYVVVENIEVWTGITLTIEPGVTVRFDASKRLQVNGTLIARGTTNDLITFTSNQANPAAGDWDNILFTDSSTDAVFDTGGEYVSGSILQFCIVEYAGPDIVGMVGAIQTQTAAPLIDHCTVRSSGSMWSSAIKADGTQQNPVVVSHNTVVGDGPLGWGAIMVSNSHVVSNTVGPVEATGISAANSSVLSNTIRSATGRGISASSNCEVIGNTVSDSGGGIWAGSNITVTGNRITGCSVEGSGGGIYASSNNLIVGNTVEGNSATQEGGGICVDISNQVISNTVVGNSAYSGGGVSAYFSTLKGNTVIGNSATHEGGGIWAGNWEVVGNTVVGNSARFGGGIYAVGTVMSNTVTANTVTATGQGSGIYFGSGEFFLYNTVVGNATLSPTSERIGGVAVEETPEFHYNNLFGNAPYDVVVMTSEDISGTHNYWGTVEIVDILAQIYDWYDDSSRGRLLYIPYLQNPDPEAPVPPPTNLQAEFSGSSVNLSWNPIPSTTTGYGYKVYYDNDSSLPPYVGTGIVEGNSPIDVGSVNTYTLTGLDPTGKFFAAVTAYDTHGRESWYSNVVWREGGSFIYLPLVLRDR